MVEGRTQPPKLIKPMSFSAFFLFAGVAAAQLLPPISAASDYAHLNRSMTPPKLIHSVDPEYTPEALAGRIEGTVVLQAIIGLKGEVTNASVLSPLPGGLGVKALEAVKHWHYQPGSMDTVDIPILTTVDVLFRLPYGIRHTPPPNPGQAAGLRDTNIPLSQGRKAEKDGQLTQAEKDFRLCAAEQNAECEYRLGKLLVSGPAVNPNDFSQGVAWLELAKEHGNQAAGKLQEASAAKLSSIQEEWVFQLKPHLEQHP